MPAASWGSQAVIQPQRQTAITPEAEQWKNRQQIVPTQPHASSPAVEDDFPSLPTTQAKKPSVKAPGKGMQRRVMRISSQKAPPPSPSGPSNVQSLCRDYNLHNVKLALTEGLEHVRGLRGDIRLGAKLGKVLWNNVSPEVQKKMWKFQDIKDLAMRENKVMPVFNNV
jgi:gentisate 1,2-dioxygenase